MNAEIIKFLTNFSTNEEKANSVIVSAFLDLNNLTNIKNRLISKYALNAKSSFAKQVSQFTSVLRNSGEVLNLEFLIELFEFVVSPKDKVVNGAVYTPKRIRDFIVTEIITAYDGDLTTVKACDLSVGCGGFLFSLAQVLKTKTAKSLYSIFRDNLYGLDIAPYSIERTKIFLSLFAILHDEDCETFQFNLYEGNALDFNWQNKNGRTIATNGGFDMVLGNPPYVCSRNIHRSSLKLLEKWTVSSTGHPDLYIPFFQIGYENLREGGVLGFITVNTFFKSINGRALRQFFADKKASLTILNFGGEQVFRNRNTYTCICFLGKEVPEQGVKYSLTKSTQLKDTKEINFSRYSYERLDHKDGWNLLNTQDDDDFVRSVEKIGTKFKDVFTTRNGIATLKNEIYKFNPIKENKSCYYFYTDDGVYYAVEKRICRPVVNANRVKNQDDVLANSEKIIFPYTMEDGVMALIPASNMRKKFPKAWKYLGDHKDILGTRDKGKAGKKYEAWYAYGRRQSLEGYSYKLFFPHICQRPTFVISEDPDLLFYNGVAVVSEKIEELLILKRLLESNVFYRYIKNTTKSYSSDFISLSRNYIKNFGIPKLSIEQKAMLLSIADQKVLQTFIEGLYQPTETLDDDGLSVGSVVETKKPELINEQREVSIS